MADAFDQIISHAGSDTEAEFATAFRGYDRDQVDSAVRALRTRLRGANAELDELREAAAQEPVASDEKEQIARLEGELAAASAKIQVAENQIDALTEELRGASTEDAGGGRRFEEILRVAEDQASVIMSNASVHGERLLEIAREEAAKVRQEAQLEADSILTQAQQDADQMRLRTETEQTAHDARLEREAAHAAEKIAQAEREAAAIRSEAEKGVAALRALVARETQQQRTDAEAAVRELQLRASEFEASLTRRQDDAQQEFLMLHTQAVAHAERITADANEQVTSSLEHAKRVSARADDFERLARAQAQQVEADAAVRARARVDEAHDKAEHILGLVSAHAQSVLRDAEDRTRQLRWQQQELTSFVAEVKDLIRYSGPAEGVEALAAPVAADAADETEDAEAAAPAQTVVYDEEPIVEDAPLAEDPSDDADLNAEADDAETDDEAHADAADIAPTLIVGAFEPAAPEDDSEDDTPAPVTTVTGALTDLFVGTDTISVVDISTQVIEDDDELDEIVEIFELDDEEDDDDNDDAAR